MNGKQARMLRQMKATKLNKKHWATLSKKNKGRLRYFHENNPKMIHFTYPHALEWIGLDLT